MANEELLLEMEESQRELEKNFGTGEAVAITTPDAFDELNKAGAEKLRERANAKNADTAGQDAQGGDAKSKEVGGDEPKGVEEVGKSAEAAAEVTDYSAEVMDTVLKNADGELVELIDANEPLADLAKGFAVALGESNERVEWIAKNAIAQNNALIQFRKEVLKSIGGLVEIIGDLPANHPAAGKVADLRKSVSAALGESEEAAPDTANVDKALGAGSAAVAVDKFGGVSPSQLSSVVKSVYDNPELRSKYNMNSTMLACGRRGVSILSKSLQQDLPELIEAHRNR